MRVLVVGLGGIGQRHSRNLRALYGKECDLLACRVRRESPVLTDTLSVADGTDSIELAYGIRSFDAMDAALAERPDAAIICNPSSLHVPAALAAARAGCHLFIEKPVSHSLEQLDELSDAVKAKSLVCMIGYQLRFHPCLILARRILSDGVIGRPLACRAVVGEFLPGWHRYEDYRGMYASRRVLGGGVVLSQIHELDILYWFFGRPNRIVSFGGHFSDLEIDVEDVASTLLSYERMVAHLHQDYLQQPPSRQLEIVGSAGKMLIDLRAARVVVHGESGALIEDRTFRDLERNTLFLDEMRCFIDAVRTGSAVPVDLAGGRQSLEMALAVTRSMDSGEQVLMSATP